MCRSVRLTDGITSNVGDDPQIVPKPIALEYFHIWCRLKYRRQAYRFIGHVPPAVPRDDLGIVPYGCACFIVCRIFTHAIVP